MWGCKHLRTFLRRQLGTFGSQQRVPGPVNTWLQASGLSSLPDCAASGGSRSIYYLGHKASASTCSLSQRSYVQPAFSEVSSEDENLDDVRPQSMPMRTRRSGLLAVKAGMTHAWDDTGARIPLTVLWVDNCQVVQAKSVEREGYTAVQLGLGSKRAKRMPATQRGHFLAAGLPFKRKLAEFRVTDDAMLPVGTELRADHFTAGQHVDIQGRTIGKGFQGVMKRWGFAGQPASHGNSKAHRKAGSTGACQDPGKIWKGKKMAGHMGNKLRTVLSVRVHKVDPVRNLLWVIGQVPGHKGNFVKVADAVMKIGRPQPAAAIQSALA